MDRQYVGIDFHRRRSVIVRKNAEGEKLGSTSAEATTLYGDSQRSPIARFLRVQRVLSAIHRVLAHRERKRHAMPAAFHVRIQQGRTDGTRLMLAIDA
jgi:hypothetical protein